MKWIIIIVVAAVAYMIITDNMGGAKDAANNYRKVMTSGSNKDAKPAPIYQYLKDKPKGSLY